MRIRLLGGFSVSVGARTIEESAWRLKKAAALIKLLALTPNNRLHREQVMDALWPDLSPKAASNNLRGVLHVARRVLDPDPSDASQYLSLHGDQVALGPEGQLWVDVEAFEEATVAARHSKDPAAYRMAIELYAGELLPEDRYEGWAEEHGQRLRETRLSLLLGLARLHEERREYEPAVEVLRRVLLEEPAREEAHAGLMRVLALSGRKGQALAHYERLEEVLLKERGPEPSASSRALREEITAGRFPPRDAHAPGSPPEEASDATKHNLPAPRTSFVGRQREMVEVKRSLAMTRLLTLTGSGGSGKTRLALEVTRDLIGLYPDGVWLVELAPVSDGTLVVQVVANALGVREFPGLPLTDMLVGALRTKQMVLLLDNCEHLVDACAHLTDTLLGSCPHVRILATSREPLGVAGETIWQVSSLSAPDIDRLPAVGELTRYDAVRLFVDRARLRLADYGLTPQNGRVVAEICRKLEGMPLAIELATARLGTLAVEEVAQRLEDSLSLLTTGPRTVAPRQRTMRSTLEWSYELLSEPEKKLLNRLSTFAGGWTLEAAAAVGSDDLEETNVLDLLGRLVDKSLVVAESIGQGDRIRYRMLEPVNQYAQELLDESSESDVVRGRHASFFLELAEKAEPELRGQGQVAWLKQLEEEHSNLRAAMAWLLERGEIEAAVRLAYALLLFWYFHGHQSEVRRWVVEALAKGNDLPDHVRAKALVLQGVMSYGLVSPEEMKRMCEESAGLFRRVGDKLGLGFAVSSMGVASLQQAEAEQATALFEEGVELFREVGDKWGVSTALAHLGTIPLSQGDHERAARYFEEALELTREIGNMLSGYISLYNLALAAQGQGDHERAAQLYREGLRYSLEAGDKANIAYCLEGLAEVARARDELELAVRLFGTAEALLEDAGGVLYLQAQDRSLREHALDELRLRLDEKTFAAALAEGRAMLVEEALEYALSKEKPSILESPAAEQPSTEELLSVLTHREEEVALLVTRGLTNRQIATELTISEHTVATHVGKAMRKLELSSRSQLAAWVAEQGLSTPDSG